MKIRILLIFLLSCFSTFSQNNKCYYIAWNGSDEILYFKNLNSGSNSTIGVIPGVTFLTNNTSTFKTNNGHFIFQSNLGITVVNTSDASIVNSYSFPVANCKLLEYDSLTNNCYYISWNGSNEILYSTNLTSGQNTAIGVIPGVTYILNNTSTFDMNNGHFIFQSNLGLTVVNTSDASIVNTYFFPVLNCKLLEYDPTNNSCYYINWNGLDEILYCTNLTSTVTSNIGVISGVTSTINNTSTYDCVNGYYIFQSNLGITLVNTSDASVVSSYGLPIGNCKLLEFEKHCASSSNIIENSCTSYNSPSGNYIWTTSGIFHDTIPNSEGCDSTITIDLTVNSINQSVNTSGSTLTSNEFGATYQWLNCPAMTPIIGATSQFYTATTNGEYAVIVTNHGCTDTSICTAMTVAGVIENNFDQEFLIFPNPSGGNFSIDLGENYIDLEITIKDFSGNVIESKIYSKNQLLNLKLKEPKGIYLLLIEHENKRAVIRLVKQ